MNKVSREIAEYLLECVKQANAAMSGSTAVLISF